VIPDISAPKLAHLQTLRRAAKVRLPEGTGVAPRLNVQKYWCRHGGDKKQGPLALVSLDVRRGSCRFQSLARQISIGSNPLQQWFPPNTYRRAAGRLSIAIKLVFAALMTS
jgi:hypothetical protein